MRSSIGLTLVAFAAVALSMGACQPPSGTSPARPPASGGPPAAAPQPAPAQEPTPATVTKLMAPYTAISVVNLPTWVGYEKQVYRKYGLEVDTQYIATSTVLTQSMLSGELNIASSGSEATVAADLEGADIVFVVAQTSKMLFFVFSDPAIKDARGLIGKKLGVTRFGSSTDTAARYFLKENRLEPDKDVSVLQMGGVPEILAGIRSGSIDAGILSPPTSTAAKKDGLHELGDLAKINLPFHQAGVVTTRRYIKEHPDIVRNFVKGFVEAMALIRKEPEFAKEVLAKYTKMEDPEALEDTLKAYLNTMPMPPYPEAAALQTALDEAAARNPKALEAKATDFIDRQFVEELDRSGFIKSIQ